MSPKRLLLTAVVLLLTVTNTHVHGARTKQVDDGVDARGIAEAAVAEAVAADNHAMMNKFFPCISKLFKRKAGGHSFRPVFTAVADLVDERELAMIASIGWGLVPITQNLYEMYANATGRGLGDGTEYDDDNEAEADVTAKKKSKFMDAYEGIKHWNDEKASGSTIAKKQKRMMLPFRDTRTFQVLAHISQASKIGFSVVAVDCLSLIARMMGYNPWNIMESSSKIFSKIAYTGWITIKLQNIKRYFLTKGEGRDLGKLMVINDLVDGLFYVFSMIYILNYLEVQTGLAVKSLFSIGATGTLVFGLASKDIATQLISALTLHLSDKMFEGDDVRFSDGTSGKIEKMGWFETIIRNSDELVVGIPNTQLSGQRIYNLSRTARSQVKQELRISYDDVAKIPKFIEAVKQEISKDCPKLITDGSRPFRAHWRDYEKDHLQVVVDCHFLIKPTGHEYWDNRQNVLEAIYRAATMTGINF